MKKFEIPEFYRSPIISKVKQLRKDQDPRKKDFTPTLLDFGTIRFYLARHFGFCYGVENAIEIAYKAIAENAGKRIYLLSQMIHNPDVNADLLSHGVQFLQDTSGKQLIPWETLVPSDIVIIPAFGTTLEIEQTLTAIGVDVKQYNTTCPFVEKVWNRSEKLGQDKHTIIIHGKYNHEETRATFSHSTAHGASLIIKDIHEAKTLARFIRGEENTEAFFTAFAGKYSEGFDPKNDLIKIGVVNQTTMLATETQEITDYLRDVMLDLYGVSSIRDHIADTRDTLCYATNDNQSATYGLLEQEADLALVIGGHNSSNTTHLVELLEQKFKTYFIRSVADLSLEQITSFNIHTRQIEEHQSWLPNKRPITVIISSGASCPDALVDRVLQELIGLCGANRSIETVLQDITQL